MKPLLGLMEALNEFQRLKQASQRPGLIQVCGVEGPQKAYLVASLFNARPAPMILVQTGDEEAEKLAGELCSWLGQSSVYLCHSIEVLPYNVVAQSVELLVQRARAVQALISGKPCVIVVPVTSLLQRLSPRTEIVKARFTVAVGDTMSLDALCERLDALGYEHAPQVEQYGSYSRRGGIVDVFPLTLDQPIRIEFWGDVIESIRQFDLDTQQSVAQLNEPIEILPARHLFVSREVMAEAAARIQEDLCGLSRMGKAKWEKLREKVESHAALLAQGSYFEGIEQYYVYFYKTGTTLLDYIPDNATILVEDLAKLKDAATGIEIDLRERYKNWIEEGIVLPRQAEAIVSWDELGFEGKLSRRWPVIELVAFEKGLGVQKISVPINIRPVPSFSGQWKLFLEELKKRQQERYTVVIVCSSPLRARRLAEVLRDEGKGVSFKQKLLNVTPGSVTVTVGPITSGFELQKLRLLVITEKELFGRSKKPKTVSAFRGGLRISDYQQLKEGDYVVHVHHGIGIYEGIKTLEVDGVKRDYLVVKYAGADRLYVPTDQIGLIQKYVGSEGKEPKLSRLGGSDWSKVKRKVKESVKAMAEELLQLYAIRQTIVTKPCMPDSPWQREFEEMFPYEETPDQLKATEEIKRDLESAKPMERLLCGDVGYGKTEVAIRAAFKVVTESRQVAVLVPTTILAYQHYRTFTERFSSYPVRIEMLSRFKTAKEQQAILEGLRDGSVDIVIGTHRLLQDDVQFKSLGLLIIDEEQRFGVTHKERLKQLRQDVNVLILSATPIPRTLHMSLVGLMDMSVIETPPEDRYPVQTYVVEYNESLIREAIRRELARRGQVYYVYNRVETIDSAFYRLKKLVPEARIAIAHGQMKEEKLEQVMIDFLAGEYDVLLCTTIIESGLDIANVNTLIVENADTFGLAQLYQLRGRVGRSNRVAYAYFTYRKDKVLTESAEKRLQAIHEFTELGSGFKIALRDLEIRGAGNILGPEQHGFIVSVGFDLYMNMLNEAVNELKGQPVKKERMLPSVELPVNAYVPDSYIPDPKQKIEVYKRIASVNSLEELSEVDSALTDRFGEMPDEVKNLFKVTRLRLMGSEVGVSSIGIQADQLVIRFQSPDSVPVDVLAVWASNFRGKVRFGKDAPVIIIKVRNYTGERILKLLEYTLEQWNEMTKAKLLAKMNKSDSEPIYYEQETP